MDDLVKLKEKCMEAIAAAQAGGYQILPGMVGVRFAGGVAVPPHRDSKFNQVCILGALGLRQPDSFTYIQRACSATGFSEDMLDSLELGFEDEVGHAYDPPVCHLGHKLRGICLALWPTNALGSM